MFKKFLLPIILFVVLGVLSFFLLDTMANGASVLFYVLIAELLLLLYFWRYQLQKAKKSGLYYIYVTVIVLFLVIYTLLLSFLYASAAIAWTLFLGMFWVVFLIGIGLLILLGFVYGGLNDALKNQNKGENNLAKMKDICRETIFVLEQYKKDAGDAIQVLKEVEEALEYSDPVTHKKVYGIERQIVGELKTGLRHAKNKLFGKVKSVMKDSNGVLYLIKKRNTVLKDSK